MVDRGSEVVVIDSEFESLIPSLSEDEYQQLEDSITTEGYHDWEPIVTWNGTIIDGHNRYHICDEHGIEFTTREMQFESRDAAKIWIIEHQFGRRNLTSGQRAALAIDLHEAEVREQARMRQVQAGKENGKGMNNSLGSREPKLLSDFQLAEQPKSQKGRTAEILGDIAGVGHMTIKRAMKVKQEDEGLYDKVRKGEIPVTTAYEQVTGKKSYKRGCKSAQYAEDGCRIYSICGKPINDGEQSKYHQGLHADCYRKRDAESFRSRRGRDADYDLRNNVAVYTIKSLTAELVGSAEMMRHSVEQSIRRNEDMGVRIPDEQKEELDIAIANVFRVIQIIGGNE